MKRSLYSEPDSFSLLPLVSLLPVLGKISKLESLTSSFYARYEKVKLLQSELNAGEGQNKSLREGVRRYSAEEAMLRQVLDWLEVQPESEKE